MTRRSYNALLRYSSNQELRDLYKPLEPYEAHWPVTHAERVLAKKLERAARAA